jgi:protein-disulfide isomerase
MLASCGDNDKYFLFLKILFAKQSSWAYSTNFEEILKNIARLSGMSEEEFNKCMNNQAVKDSLTRQRMVASQVLKLEGTPAFYMNGAKIKIDSYENFSAIINSKLVELEKKS